MIECERNIVQNFHTVNRLGNSVDCKHFISDLTIWLEIDIRIFAAGRADLFKLNLLQRALSGSRLTGFGSVGAESGNEFL